MMDIPAKQIRENFKQLFVRGALFHCCNYDFTDGTTKDKFILVLNGCDQSGKSYFYMPTSQIKKARNNRLLTDSLFIFPGGTIKSFSQETAIIIRTIHSKAFAYFEQKYLIRSGPENLSFKEMIPNKILNDIYRLILASHHISLKEKRLILPEHLVFND